MRHQRTINHLGRTSTHRKAMLSNMAASLILHKRIKTTLAKAKALRGYVEPLINRAKEDTTANRRLVFSYLQNKEAVSELFREISQKILERPGGYTRILKTGTRLGDRAEMCFIELVDYNLTYGAEAADKKAKAKGTRRGPRKKAGEEKTAAATDAAVEEKPKKTKKAAPKAEKPVQDDPAPEAEGDAKAGE
jgi:large subunit ribosomal protein L17